MLEDTLGAGVWFYNCNTDSDDGREGHFTRRFGFWNIFRLNTSVPDKDSVTSFSILLQIQCRPHVAAQPSAPYSQINGKLANYPQLATQSVHT